ncbi:hypothetical protein F5Y03DRAFT_264584 [Xylaria venustula]|nr:hypothetical protein F5Y03DRAFT_264584 [Xylaria venustula]
MEPSFSDDEKRFVLAEIIKVSAIDVPTLVEFIRAHNIVPDWLEMQLPGGRNMNHCVRAVERMFQVSFPPPNIASTGSFGKRRSGDLIDYPPAAKRQAITAAPPYEPTLTPVRHIQPRPPASNGYPLMAPMSSAPAIPATGKKRGRPSKADKEAQAQARAGAGYPRHTDYTPITPAPPAPLPAPPQREHALPPGYDIASSVSLEQGPSKRPRPAPVDSPRQGSDSLPLVSPASTTGTPRALPEPTEPMERTNISPRDHGSVPVDSRSPPLAPLMQQHDQPQLHSQILPRPQVPLVPIQPSPRPPQVGGPYNRPDPIFPDRDRSRSMTDQASRNASASPVVSRI